MSAERAAFEHIIDFRWRQGGPSMSEAEARISDLRRSAKQLKRSRRSPSPTLAWTVSPGPRSAAPGASPSGRPPIDTGEVCKVMIFHRADVSTRSARASRIRTRSARRNCSAGEAAMDCTILEQEVIAELGFVALVAFGTRAPYARTHRHNVLASPQMPLFRRMLLCVNQLQAEQSKAGGPSC